MGLARLDVFPKIAPDYRSKSAVGGLLTIAAIFLTIVISVHEIAGWMNAPMKQRLIVDTNRPVDNNGTVTVANQRLLSLSFNVSLPFVPCPYLHMDTMSPFEYNTAMPPIAQGQVWTRLRSDGSAIGQMPEDFWGTGLDPCGPCHERSEKACCRSCKDVIEVHRNEHFRLLPLAKIPQCAKTVERLAEMAGEGCRLTTTVIQPRIGSELHVSLGLAMDHGGQGYHFHDIATFDKTWKDFNMSHRFDSLYFGHYEAGAPSPLADVVTVQRSNVSWMHTVYQVRIVGDDYSAERFVVENPAARIQPGIRIAYDVSPLVPYNYVERPSLSELLSQLVMVVGGVAFAFRILDGLINARQKPAKLT